MSEERRINAVAVLGSGTMGSGIAAACAQTGCRVLLLDVSRDLADQAVERMQSGRSPALEDADKAELITTGSFDGDIAALADYDWICEAIVEDLGAKRALFERIEAARRDGSVMSTNTSGIPLRAISEGMPQRLRRDIAVTHFFNPVKVMRLVELVPGVDTTADVMRALAHFCGERLGKGVVHAKDTVNFIGNRIGCFWMLAGLHKGRSARARGLTVERIDALLGAPVGLPPTGLYGLIDLVGLDVMDLVVRNLQENLPTDDIGRQFATLPPEEQAMLERGQLGRKTGGGFYRLTKRDDGSRLKEVYELGADRWRVADDVTLDDRHGELASLAFADDDEGRFVWELMAATLGYAADLIPEIADDIVNIDRAMRWGFNWQRGPFEMLDALEPNRVIERLRAEGAPVPRMLAVLQRSGQTRFYSDAGTRFLGADGDLHPVPAA